MKNHILISKEDLFNQLSASAETTAKLIRYLTPKLYEEFRRFENGELEGIEDECDLSPVVKGGQISAADMVAAFGFGRHFMRSYDLPACEHKWDTSVL